MAARKFIVKLSHDPDLQDPTEDEGGFKVYSFGRRHRNYADPSKFLDDHQRPRLAFANKLRAGTAFLLSYYEHGNCQWSLQGRGPSCQWDTVRMAGVLLWEGKPAHLGKTFEVREKAAELFLETYTAWSNGYGYGYNIEEEVTMPCGHTETKDVGSCWGFYGTDTAYMLSEVRSEITHALKSTPGAKVEIVITGDAKDIADADDFMPKVEVPSPEATH